MAKQSLLVFGLDDQLYLGRFGLNVQLRDDELDGAALNEDREEDDEEGCCQEDPLERGSIIQDHDQGEADSTP